jgi:predicted ABC-type ATPase
MSEPTLIVIGGANGSGKTTLAREYIAVENLPYLGADQIAYDLNPDNVESVAIEAGRLFVKKIAESIANRQSFIVESTLSGLSLRKWIKAASDAGYFVKLAFIYLDSPELCIDRVSVRVARGGHHVPDEDIFRRYTRSNKNFWNHYSGLADQWKLFNNTHGSIRPVATGEGNDIIVADIERFSIWLEMVTEKNCPSKDQA